MIKRMNKKNTTDGNLNALRLGLRSAQNLLLPGELAEDFESLLRGYIEQLLPQTVAEQQVVARVVGLRWKVHRVDATEDALLRSELERQLGQTQEFKTDLLLQRAVLLTQGLLAMVPTFAAATPQEAEKVLLNGLQTGLGMVDAVAVKVHLPVGVLADLVSASNELKLTFIVENTQGEYLAALKVLEGAVARAHQALLEAQKESASRLSKKAEELRHKVRLNIATIRLLDRYRASLERSVERELAHLKAIVELRARRQKSLGSRKAPRLPPVVLKVV